MAFLLNNYMRKNILFYILLFVGNICFGQEQQIQFETNYNHHIRNVKIPHDVVCKVKNKKDKIRGLFYNLKNDTLFFREYYTNDTFKICWNTIEWMRIKRNALASILYDGWMIGSWALTGVGATFIYFAFSAPQGSEAGLLLIPGLPLFAISLPQAIISTSHRFKKYNPQQYQIRMK